MHVNMGRCSVHCACNENAMDFIRLETANQFDGFNDTNTHKVRPWIDGDYATKSTVCLQPIPNESGQHTWNSISN